MSFVYLGWGSLIWDPRELPIDGDWHINGPVLPIEFTRHSSRNRITLIIDPMAKPVTTLWCRLQSASLQEAISALKAREGVSNANSIHHVSRNTQPASNIHNTIHQWMTANDITGVVWTGLGYNRLFLGGRRPAAEQVVHHLAGLQGEERTGAEEYICRAPQQINTAYRQQIKAALGWTYRP